MNKFTAIPADDFIWNQHELLKFLIDNQKKDIFISLNSEGPCCRNLGLYDLLDLFDFKSVTIMTSNALEHHEKYQILTNFSEFPRVKSSVDAQYQTWDKSQVFCAFYGRPLWHRVGLASHLTAHHSEMSIVGFHADYHNDDARKLFEIQKLINYAPGVVSDFSKLASQLPLQGQYSASYDPGNPDATDAGVQQLRDYYTNILIDIVSESFTGGTTFFPTEKTFRPMLLKKPFITMGPINHLIYLRQMGFQTFYDFWSEDYDGYAPRWKFQKIIDLIDILAKKTKSELYQMYQDMQPILNHNYDLLINRAYDKQIIQIND